MQIAKLAFCATKMSLWFLLVVGCQGLSGCQGETPTSDKNKGRAPIVELVVSSKA